MFSKILPTPYIFSEGEKITPEHSSVDYETRYKALATVIIIACLVYTVVADILAVHHFVSNGNVILLVIVSVLAVISMIPHVWNTVATVKMPGHMIGLVPVAVAAMIPSSLALALASDGNTAAMIISSIVLISSCIVASLFSIASVEIAAVADAIVCESNGGETKIGETWKRRRRRKARRRILLNGGETPKDIEIANEDSNRNSIFVLDEDGNLAEDDEATYGIGGVYGAGTIIVLGYRIDDGRNRLSPRHSVLQHRLVRAVAYARHKSAASPENNGLIDSPLDAPIEGIPFILTGGQTVSNAKQRLSHIQGNSGKHSANNRFAHHNRTPIFDSSTSSGNIEKKNERQGTAIRSGIESAAVMTMEDADYSPDSTKPTTTGRINIPTDDIVPEVSEALVMSRMIEGVASDDIYLETMARNTEDNIEYAIAKMEELNLPYPAVIVTSRYHIPRVGRIAKRVADRGDVAFTDAIRFVPAKVPLSIAPQVWCEEVMASINDFWMYGGIGGGEPVDAANERNANIK